VVSVSALRDAALAYARRGLPVFPVRARGKQPLIPNPHRQNDPARDTCKGECGRDGHGLWDGTVDLDRVRTWWTRWPSANIGVRTGERFDVLDLDGAAGIASMEAFAAEHGFSLERVPWVATPRGGRHYFYEPTGLGNAANKLEGVDWRGHGGYVVVGPSVHPNGRAYQTVPDGAGRPAFVPAALRALLDPPKPEPAPRPATFRPASTSTAYARAALEGTQARILGAARGERNMAAFREGAALFGLVAGGVVDEAEATTMLDDAMRSIGLGAREIGATVDSARRRGMQRPRGMPAAPSTVAVPTPGAVLSEDSFAAWANGKAQVAPCLSKPSPMVVLPSGRLLNIYRTLEWKSRIDGQGRRVQDNVSHEHLMRHYRIGQTTVEGELRRLEQLGALRRERIPAERQPDGRMVGKRNRYVLLLEPRAVQNATIDRITVPQRSQADEQAAPCLGPEKAEAQNHGITSIHQEAFTTEGWIQPVGGEAAVPEPEPWPTGERGDLLPVRLVVPEAARLDHDPTAAEILGAIKAGLGEARVLGAIRHDDPETAAKLSAIHAGSAPLPDGWSWRERWHAEPVGPCVRCGEPANTAGPDGRPWHPLCWGSAGTPPPRPAYQAGTRARPRVLDLAGSLGDFHHAVDLLDRDTCLDAPCRPRQPCRRHTRRKREEITP